MGMTRRFVRMGLVPAAWLGLSLLLAQSACDGDDGGTGPRDPDGGQGGIVDEADARVPPGDPDASACVANPIEGTDLYLRGSFNNWGFSDEARLVYECNRFRVAVEIVGSFEFKVADADWSTPTTFGAGAGGAAVEIGVPIVLSTGAGGPNLSMVGGGVMTFSLDLTASVDMPTLTVTEGGDGGPDIGDNEVAQTLRFDSRDLRHKAPFGAVIAGTPVTFTLAARAGALPGVSLVIERQRLFENQLELEYTEIARVAMAVAGQSEDGSEDLWAATYTFDEIAVYGYYFETTIGEDAVVYGNNNIAIPYTLPVGAGGRGSPAYRPASASAIRRFRQTIYDAAFTTPEWAQDAIYYYIFPERFRNGDRTNDPTPGVDTYVGDLPVEKHSSWIDPGPFVPGTDRDGQDGDDEHFNNDFYGGDLQGIIDKLDYIADLGANTLYINPIFESPSNHKYDTSNYLAVDDNFGDAAVFATLVAEADRRGIRILLDTSLNHCSPESPYMDRYGDYAELGAFENEVIRPESAFYDWFQFNPEATNPDEQYQSWLGITTLANLAESDSYKEFAYRADDSVTRTWLRRGASGWRMDVTPWVEDSFWREWRVAVKQEDDDALALAETWFDSSKYFLGDMFDSTMNYIFRDTVIAFAGGGSARNAMNVLEMTREHYPAPAYRNLMNLLSTHDAPRALFQFGYDVGETSFPVIALAKQRLLLAMLLQMTYPGAPTLFYGDEVGLTGGPDPLNRRTYPWRDRGGNPDQALRVEVRKLIRLRSRNEILRRGDLRPLYSDDNVVVFLRQLGGASAIVALNNADSGRSVTVDLAGTGVTGTLTNLLRNGDRITVAGEQVTLQVPALFGSVYASRRAR
jgi:cyclomaltodextrinase / maltogenic alpha-amylase / neopullulanase